MNIYLKYFQATIMIIYVLIVAKLKLRISPKKIQHIANRSEDYISNIHTLSPAISWWFSPGILVSSINKTDHHDIAEILLKVALNTINLNQIVWQIHKCLFVL